MSFYEGMARLALEQVKRFGKEIPIRRYTTVSDPIAGTSQRVLQQEGNLLALVLPASRGTIEAFDNRVGNDMVLTNLRYVVIAAESAPFEPLPFDEIEAEGQVWRVLGTTPLSPGETPILYRMGVQRV